MNLALVLLVLAAVLPVFFAKVRVAPLWLGLQAVALAALTLVHAPEISLHSGAALLEVLLLRAVAAPLLLHRAIRLRGAADRDLMPSNLFTWLAAVGLIALAFHFADGATTDTDALALGAVATLVLLAFLLLASNGAPVAQLVAVLYLENGIAVFEMVLPQGWPLPVHLALGLVYLGTVAVGHWLVSMRSETAL